MWNKCKNIRFEILYSEESRNSKTSVERRAVIQFSEDTTFADLNEFMADCQEVIADYIHCCEKSLRCKVLLSSATFTRSLGSPIEQQNFKEWTSIGTPEAEDAKGLYLNPDPMSNAEENHDIYIDFSKPLLKQLSEANI